MDRVEILEVLKEVIAETLDIDPDQISEDSRLEEDLGADSLDGVEIAMALEDKLDFEMADDSFEDLHKVSDIIDYLEGILA